MVFEVVFDAVEVMGGVWLRKVPIERLEKFVFNESMFDESFLWSWSMEEIVDGEVSR